MEIRAYVQAIRDGWKVGVLVAVLVIVAGAVLAVTTTAVYQSTTRLYVSTQVDSADPVELSQRSAIAQQRVVSYAQALDGNVLARQVSEELDREIDPGEVTATVVPGTVVISITAADPDPEGAQQVAAAYAELAPTTIRDLERGGEGGWQTDVSVIDMAEEGVFAGRAGPVLTVLLAILVGVGLGVTAAATWGLARRALTSRTQPTDPT